MEENNREYISEGNLYSDLYDDKGHLQDEYEW